MSFGTLYISYADGRLETFALTKPTVDVGSAPANDVVLDDDSVAEYQAQLLCDAGGCEILALDNSGNLLLDGAPLDAQSPVALHDGATLEIGTLSVLFRAPASTRSTPHQVRSEPGGSDQGHTLDTPADLTRAAIATSKPANATRAVTPQPQRRRSARVYAVAPVASDMAIEAIPAKLIQTAAEVPSLDRAAVPLAQDALPATQFGAPRPLGQAGLLSAGPVEEEKPAAPLLPDQTPPEQYSGDGNGVYAVPAPETPAKALAPSPEPSMVRFGTPRPPQATASETSGPALRIKLPRRHQAAVVSEAREPIAPPLGQTTPATEQAWSRLAFLLWLFASVFVAVLLANAWWQRMRTSEASSVAAPSAMLELPTQTPEPTQTPVPTQTPEPTAAAVVPPPASQGPSITPVSVYVVATQTGQRLNIRRIAGVKEEIVGKLDNGAEVRVVGEPTERDGYLWVPIEHTSVSGWCILEALRPR